MLAKLWKFFSTTEDSSQGSCDKIIEEPPPKTVKFREVTRPSNKIGDIFWISSAYSNGGKCEIVNFDYDILANCHGRPQLKRDKDDRTEGTVIDGSGRIMCQAEIELLPVEEPKTIDW